jgi:hypothetical protein
VRALDLQPVARPDLARPWRAPLVPLPPMRAPSPLPLSFLFPHSNFPLRLFHLPCPRCDPVDGCRRSSDPKVSFPSPLLSPSFPFPLPACGPSPWCLASAPSPRHPCAALPGAPLHVLPRGPCARPSPAAPCAPFPVAPEALPGGAPRALPCGAPPPLHPCAALPVGAPAVPMRALAQLPRAAPVRPPVWPRARVVPFSRAAVARNVFSLISFKFSLINVLRRALRRATIHFKFKFISVLRHALRHATFHFNFRLFNVLLRAFSRATFCFKFSLNGVCHRALRRATLYVILIFNSIVLWRAPSRDDSFNFSLV